jgi:hypothetical protein
VTREQLLRLGLGEKAIKYRVKTADLYRVHAGVYAVGRPPVSPLEHAAAAVLACGPHAALSHRSALVLWGIWKRWEPPFEVTLARGDRRPLGITVHRTKVSRPDLTVHYGIRVTTPARTLLDCAPHITAKSLTRAVNDARHAHILLPDPLRDTLARHPHHRGAAKLARAAEGPATRSGWEDDFVDFCARHGLPTPQVNAIVCGLEVDAYFAEAKVIVELDSWEYHSDRAAFETDRQRDAITAAAGHVTVRITHERLDTAADAEAGRLRQIIAARATAAAPEARRRARRRRARPRSTGGP